MHRSPLLGGHAYGGIEFMGLFLGLGTLGQDALWKKEILAHLGEHLINVDIGPFDDLVEFNG
jgi:hypothetical protein